MTNPTSNFGWQMPTNTDLVTDLPADFAVFGQAVDTSMSDLLGGTTGQVLSKTSATNMDFTWINNDQGDITGVTAGTGILVTSPTGPVPTVTFDIANYGGGQFAAGKNKIINADCNINQRAFTSVTTNGSYGFDRFILGAVDGTTTYTPQTFTAGAAPVAGYESTNYNRVVSTGQTLSTANSHLRQNIEDVRVFAGQTVTFSFWAQAGTGTPKIAVELSQYFGSTGSPSASVNNYLGQVTLSTSWARYSVSVAIPSISGKTITLNNALVARLFFSAGSDLNARTGSLGIQSNTFNTWGWQVEAGSTATPFQTASGGSPQAELAMCQRYYYRVSFASTSRFGIGFANTTTSGNLTNQFPVEMRTAPTALEQNGVATDYTVSIAGTNVTCSAVPTIGVVNQYGALTTLTFASGLTAGAGLLLRPLTGAYLGWSAEL